MCVSLSLVVLASPPKEKILDYYVRPKFTFCTIDPKFKFGAIYKIPT